MTLRTPRSTHGAQLAALALAGVLLSQSVGAQEPDVAAGRLTLAEVIERARAASPVLSAARASLAAGRGEERQAGCAFRKPVPA
jgi:hypothetical protein